MITRFVFQNYAGSLLNYAEKRNARGRERRRDGERESERENPVVDCGNLAKLILERARSSITVNSQRQVQESTLDFGQKRGAGRDREQR